MKNKILTYALIPTVLGIGFLGVNLVSAQGWFGGFNNLTPDQIATRQETMFENDANMLGISVDAVKNAWAKGESLSQLATDNGITADQLKTKMQDYRLQQYKAQLQNLVDKGVITPAQADQRSQFMQTNQTNNQGKIGHRMFRGMGMFF